MLIMLDAEARVVAARLVQGPTLHTGTHLRLFCQALAARAEVRQAVPVVPP